MDPIIILAFLVAAGAAYLVLGRSGKSPIALSASGSAATQVANQSSLAAALPSSAAPYVAFFRASGANYNVDPLLLAAICQQESAFGTSSLLSQPGPAGTGDGGHGHGLMQIDDRWHADWLGANDWTDPATNIDGGASIFAGDIVQAEALNLGSDDLTLMAALSAYNTGSVSGSSVGSAYANSVWSIYQEYTSAFQAALASPATNLTS